MRGLLCACGGDGKGTGVRSSLSWSSCLACSGAVIHLNNPPPSHPTQNNTHNDTTGKDGLAPVVVSKKAAGFKDKRDGAARTRWVWTDFRNSARGDDCRAFKHWVKASTDYPDYPFARFNVAKQSVAYSEEEYAAHLTVGSACGVWFWGSSGPSSAQAHRSK